MNDWVAYHLHYTDLDRLLTDCLYPALQAEGAALSTYFWERHYAGGPHIRLRLNGAEPARQAVGARLRAIVDDFLKTYPSAHEPHYSEKRAALMLTAEGDDPEAEDLTYRNNVIVERPYHRRKEKFVSDEAVALLEAFYHDTAPLVVAILRAARSKQESMLRLAFLHCLLVGGSYRVGFLSFKAHWENYTMVTRQDLIQRIKQKYQEQRGAVQQVMLDVERHVQQQTLEADPVMAQWRDVTHAYGARIQTLLQQGIDLAPQEDETQWTDMKAWIDKAAHPSAFVVKMYEDWRFAESMRADVVFNTSRVQINLLYLLGASLGFNLANKFTMCYFASQAVEDYYECDPLGLLDQAAERLIGQQVA